MARTLNLRCSSLLFIFKPPQSKCDGSGGTPVASERIDFPLFFDTFTSGHITKKRLPFDNLLK